jgi:hypothetical protein
VEKWCYEKPAPVLPLFEIYGKALKPIEKLQNH